MNSSALVLGPTGVALGQFGTLFVADTINNRIAAIPFARSRLSPVAGGGYTVTSGGGLNAPLGMTIAPNGTRDRGERKRRERGRDDALGTAGRRRPDGPARSGGDLFGLMITPNHKAILFVDDGNNTLERFRPVTPVPGYPRRPARSGGGLSSTFAAWPSALTEYQARRILPFAPMRNVERITRPSLGRRGSSSPYAP